MQQTNRFMRSHVSKCTCRIRAQSLYWHSGRADGTQHCFLRNDSTHAHLIVFSTKSLSRLKSLPCRSLMCETRVHPKFPIVSQHHYTHKLPTLKIMKCVTYNTKSITCTYTYAVYQQSSFAKKKRKKAQNNTEQWSAFQVSTVLKR